MAGYYLINQARVGGSIFRAGSIIDDAQFPGLAGQIRAVGGVLWPTGDATIAAAAARAQSTALERVQGDPSQMDVMMCGALNSLLGGVGDAAYATQAAWALNEASGDDLAAGTSAAPLKTGEALRKLIGSNPLRQATTITVTGDMSAANPARFWYNLGVGASLAVAFQNADSAVPFYTSAGGFTAVTPIDRANNEGWLVSDSALPVSYAASGCVNANAGTSRIGRITGGARAGARFWIVKETVAKTARISPCRLSASPFPVTPQVGDPYVIEPQPLVADFSADFRSSSIITGGVNGIPITFANMALASGTNNRPTSRNMITTVVAPTVDFFGCDTGRLIFAGQGLNSFDACKTSSFELYGPGNLLSVFSCAVLGPVVVRGGGCLSLDFDTIFQGNGVIIEPGGNCLWGTAGAFDKAAGATPDGVTVRAGGVILSRTGIDSTHAMYGKGNSGVGLNMQSASQAVYVTSKPTITGAAGDFQLAGNLHAWADAPLADAATLSAILQQA